MTLSRVDITLAYWIPSGQEIGSETGSLFPLGSSALKAKLAGDGWGILEFLVAETAKQIPVVEVVERVDGDIQGKKAKNVSG